MTPVAGHKPHVKRCPVCLCRHRLRTDGTFQQHYMRDPRYGSRVYTYCLGSWQKAEEVQDLQGGY